MAVSYFKAAWRSLSNKPQRFSAVFVPRHLLAVLLVLISCLGLLKSTSFAAASLDYYFVRNTVETWQQNLQVNQEDDYLAAKSAIKSARQSHPRHPLYTDMTGQMYEWGSLAGYEDEPTALRAAKDYYRQAIAMRPTWPVSYASLAMIKWRMGEFDEELSMLLKQAVLYGPKKAETNILISEMGLALYTANHPFYLTVKPYLQSALLNGLLNSQSRARVLKAVSHFDSKRSVCRWLKSDNPYVYKSLLKCASPA